MTMSQAMMMMMMGANYNGDNENKDDDDNNDGGTIIAFLDPRQPLNIPCSISSRLST